MAEDTPFSPLDSLGPDYGGINSPKLDAQGLSAFEGDVLRDPQINFPKPETYFPVLPKVGNLDRPNVAVHKNVVKTHANNPSIPQQKVSGPQKKASTRQYLDAFFQANQNKNSYAKIYSYNAGPDGNAFYKRYAAYGQETFDKIGFSPLRNNEANFNAQTSKWDDFSRMMTHSFVPLFSRGFVSGPKSLWKMAHGDFTSGDLEDARAYEESAAIGQSSKGGVFGFTNNTMMNFGYTAGIMGEAILEEIGGALLAGPTGGASLLATTANIATKVPKALSLTERAFNGYKAVKNSLKSFESLQSARNFWNAAASNKIVSSVARGLNPLENTFEAVKAMKGADNITDLAALSKTAGGFYRDVRKINMALSEARLEAGMVENKVYDKLYHEAYMAKGEPPTNKEQAELEKQAKDASLETLLANTALIYGSNAITFHNITSPRGGLRNFIKSTTDDIYEIASREGAKDFGKIGKVVFDKATRKFELEKNNLTSWLKGWKRNPIHKSVFGTIGYFKSNFTEGIQENLQEVIAQANERYYIDSYKSPTLQTQLYSKGVIKADLKPKSSYYAEGLKDQFGSQGLETFASGFFMGTLASPLNAAIPFLSNQYNRMFYKEEFTKWKKDQVAIAENLKNELNAIDMKDFMSDRVMNSGSQDLISKIRANASKKEGLDAETESFVGAVNTMRRTGTVGLFTDTLKSFKQLDDKEFADAMKIEMDQVDKYRGRLDKSIARLNSINDIFNSAERKNPNPVNLENLGEPGSDEYIAKLALYNGWNRSIHNYAFFTEAYNDVKGRRADIINKYNSNENFKGLSSTEKTLLFQPERIKDELKILNNELAVEKETAKDSKKISDLESKIKLLSEFSEAHTGFDQFFNRADYAKQIKEQLKTKTGKEPTAEEIATELDNILGSLDNEELKTYHLLNVKRAHNNYLKTVASANGEYVFDENTEEGFEMLMDYYKMGHEAQSLAQYVDIMNDPTEFMESARRNAEWMRKFYMQRVKYFEDLVNSEIGKVRDNALLNTLADNQLYLNKEDMENYLGDKNIPPSEIYDAKTKQIYPEGSEEYNKIYAEYFEKRAELKSQLKPKKTNVVKKTYEAQINELKEKMQDEIDALPKETVKEYGEDIKRKGKKKSVTIQEIAEQLQPEEYVEVDYKDAIEPMVFYKDAAGELRYDNAEGEILEIPTIKTRFTEAKKFTYNEKADEAEVKKIQDKYDAMISEIMDAYNADMQDIESEEPYEEVTQDSDLTEYVDFRNMLYNEFIAYVDTLPQEEQDAIYADDNVTDAEFEKWYKLPENKKYFDKYNKENKPTGPKNNVVFTFEGTDIDTKDLGLPEIIKYRDNINTKINNLSSDIEEAEEFEYDADEVADKKKQRKALMTDVRNLNAVISRRQYEGFPAEIKEAVQKIQILIEKQKGVEENYLLTADDPVTGLKKGETAYRVNGLIHRRVTNAIQEVLGKEYEYQGKKQVESAFNNTIGVKGLNQDSINDFISQLNALLEIDQLPGTNALFLEKLTDQLRALDGLTPEQIKLEKQKDVLLDKLDAKDRDIIKAEENNLPERVNNLVAQKNEILKELDAVEKQLKGQKPTKISAATQALLKTIDDLERRELEREKDSLNERYKINSDETIGDRIRARYEKQRQDVILTGKLSASLNKAKIADIEKRRKESIISFIKSRPRVKLSSNDEIIKAKEELNKQTTEINDQYDAEYLEAVKKGEIPKEMAMSAISNADGLNRKAYKELAALEGTDTESKVVTVYHHTNVAPKDFNFGSFQRGKQQISQFGDGLNASSTTTPFLVQRYGNPIKGEINDSDFITIDANKSQKEMYEILVSKGFKFNNPQMGKETPEGGKYVGGTPASEYDDTTALKDSPGAAIDLFNDFQQSNPEVKGVKVINHIIGAQKVDPFYVIYDAKSFYGPGSLSKTQPSVSKDIKAEEESTSHNTTKDIVLKMFAEETYQDSRDAGNFLDDAKDYLESGIKPKFDESKISQSAYDNLFGPAGFLTNIKQRVDAGEFYLVGRGLVVYDSDITRADGSKDRIAGEIDLLLATKDGLMIVDIKSGEMRKWANFNQLSKAEDKRNYSKREEYTLQQGAYATMLEKMIDYPVSGIALLAIERSSDKQTNAMVSAGKPSGMSIYYDQTYQQNPDGTYKRNDFGELISKSAQTKFSDWMVPLYRETVQDKLDILFPPGEVKFMPGLKEKATKEFNNYLVDIQSITNEDTEQNRTALNKIEEKINNFAQNNNLEIPENVKEALKEKKLALGQVVGKKLIDKTITKYEGLAAQSKSEVDKLAAKLSTIKSDILFDNINLDPSSAFIQEQLEKDEEFANRYAVHFNQFLNATGEPTTGQLVAADTLHKSGILTDEEYEFIENGEANKEEVSEMIHESVKRIQYLKANSETNEELNKFKEYQSQIIKLITTDKVNQSNIGIANALKLANAKIAEGDVKMALDLVNAEVFKLESQLKYTTKEFVQKKIQEKIDDLNKVTEAIITTTGYVEEVFVPEQEVVEGEVEEFDNEEQLDKIIVKKGMDLYRDNAKFTVQTVHRNNTVTLRDSSGNKLTVTMEELNKNYKTENDLLGPEVAPEEITLTPEEQEFVNQSEDNVDALLDKDEVTDALMAEADKIKSSDKAEDDLLDDLNCK